MNNITLKSDNLEKLLNGLSLLDERDQERVIGVVDALHFADKKAVNAKTPPGVTEKLNTVTPNLKA